MKSKILLVLFLLSAVFTCLFSLSACKSLFNTINSGGGKKDHTHEYYPSDPVKPTCTSEGFTMYVCLCGDSYKDDIVPKLAHTYSQTLVVEPTCTAEGYTLHTCACGDKYKDNITEKLPHQEVVISAVPATCNNEGRTEGKYCNICKTVLKESQPIGKLDHKVKDFVCVDCGYTDKKVTGLLQYSEYRDSTGKVVSYSVSGIGEATSKDIVIPASYKGLPVERVSDSAFSYCDIQSITFLGGMKAIGRGAFYKCTDLKSVYLPRTINSVSRGAFEGCVALTDLHISDGADGIGLQAFKDCSQLAEVSLPDSVKDIRTDSFVGTAFYNDTGNWTGGVLYSGNHLLAAKTSVSGIYGVAQGTKVVAGNAFDGCASLTGFIIPDSVIALPATFISNCHAVEKLEVSSGNTVYISKGNCILSGNVLIKGCKTSVIDASVKEIGDYAFYKCSLSGVTLPYGVKKIGDCAFNGCSGLSTFTIPSSVTELGVDAFSKSDIKSFSSDTVAEIPASAFNGCASLEEVSLGQAIRTIGARSFENCTNLKKLTVNKALNAVQTDAFKGCDALADVNIPAVVIAAIPQTALTEVEISCGAIGENAFRSSNTLSIVTIGVGVTSIGRWAFAYCNNLATLRYRGTSAQWTALQKGAGWNLYSGFTVEYI